MVILYDTIFRCLDDTQICYSGKKHEPCALQLPGDINGDFQPPPKVAPDTPAAIRNIAEELMAVDSWISELHALRHQKGDATRKA